jgi:hypothetical protein
LDKSRVTNAGDDLGRLTRAHGDIQTAVVRLVDRLAPIVPVARQPALAHEIAEVIASRPSSMRNNMFLRQSIFRRGVATDAQVIDGLAAWVTVLFDLGNLQQDRSRALDLKAELPDAALTRLSDALGRSPNGCILAVPHIGSIELFVAHLKNRGFNLGFVYTIGKNPTPTERWIHAGRSATFGTPIAFGRRNTGAEIARILHDRGVVLMVVDVYPSDKFRGINVRIHDAEFRYPPGPARFARAGTLVLPGFASRRGPEGFSMDILDPLEGRTGLPAGDAALELTQNLASHVDGFTAAQPSSYWLWHPIPNDPFLAVAQTQRRDLLNMMGAATPDDEAVAASVEATGLS